MMYGMKWWFLALALLFGILEDLCRRGRVANPEVHMNVSEVISYHGYPSEEYEVLTDDGYYLTINRIPFGQKNLPVGGPKAVVLLQHGVVSEASFWVENMANNSFGFILADAGYDVWLGNSRGSSCSQRHQHLSTDQDEFWDFSFHEMGMYDIPAVINFILKKTGQKQLYYVGYSEGAATGLIAFSAIPELSQKIKTFFALAPVISLRYSTSLPFKLGAILPQYSTKGLLVRGEFYLAYKSWRLFTNTICSVALLQTGCAYTILLPGGINLTNINMSRLDVYAARFPDRTSAKNIVHWNQLREKGIFRCFDYENENQARYNQSFPPEYKIENMTVPTAVWFGGNDLIAAPGDIDFLLPRITNLIYYENITHWNHWDFLWGLSAPRLLYSKIMELMGKSL
ncbi:lipase member M-like [Lacerta agilis]|uniref:lipase member M-like n=1 Tax=Lacerta agilis TaxID=80427 RepID=UPI00141943FB|nr:lipase member M-like [Lacerta agilis]